MLVVTSSYPLPPQRETTCANDSHFSIRNAVLLRFGHVNKTFRCLRVHASQSLNVVAEHRRGSIVTVPNTYVSITFFGLPNGAYVCLIWKFVLS